MKNTNKCPKCYSQKILKIDIPPIQDGPHIPMGMWKFNAIGLVRYVCASCGFSEEWIDSPDDLQKLKEKYGDS